MIWLFVLPGCMTICCRAQVRQRGSWLGNYSIPPNNFKKKLSCASKFKSQQDKRWRFATSPRTIEGAYAHRGCDTALVTGSCSHFDHTSLTYINTTSTTSCNANKFLGRSLLSLAGLFDRFAPVWRRLSSQLNHSRQNR